MREDLLKGLTEEQIKKVKSCKSPNELLELAKKEGVELTDEQLKAISGGWCTQTPPPCPFCGSKNTIKNSDDSGYAWYCQDCRSPYWS